VLRHYTPYQAYPETAPIRFLSALILTRRPHPGQSIRDRPLQAWVPADLGAKPVTTFLTVTLPLTIPGIIAGSLLVFIPATGEFVIPDLLGGGNVLMIGRLLYNEFTANHDWPVASAVAIILLIVLVLPMMLYQHTQGKQAEG